MLITRHVRHIKPPPLVFDEPKTIQTDGGLTVLVLNHTHLHHRNTPLMDVHDASSFIPAVIPQYYYADVVLLKNEALCKIIKGSRLSGERKYIYAADLFTFMKTINHILIGKSYL